MANKKDILRWVSLGATALSAVCSFVSAIVDSKKSEIDLAEEVEKAVAKRLQTTTKES